VWRGGFFLKERDKKEAGLSEEGVADKNCKDI
jgi:hypothetical protein